MFYVITGKTAQSFGTFEEAADVYLALLISGTPAVLAQRVEVELRPRVQRRTRDPERNAIRDHRLLAGESPIIVSQDLEQPYQTVAQAAHRLGVPAKAPGACPICHKNDFKNRAGLAGHVWTKHRQRLSDMEREASQ